MTDFVTVHLPRLRRSSPLMLLCLLGLSACATSQGHKTVAAAAPPPPVLPSEQYPLQAQGLSKSISLRINANGLSDNQRRALDQVAEHASWTSGEAVDVAIITSGDPAAISAGRNVGAYLTGHDVPRESLTVKSAVEQPADIITVTLTYYRGRTYDCNQSWENLAATGSNQVYANYGCAVTSNLAAQIADPRDINRAATSTPGDAGRKSVILGKYRTGEVTSAAQDDQSKGTISDAIK